MSWQRTYACWRQLSRKALVAGPSDLLDLTWWSMVEDLRRILWEAGWSASDLARPLAPTIDIHMTDSHVDHFTTNTVALIAEARALQLLNPEPLPDLRPFRWRRL